VDQPAEPVRRPGRGFFVAPFLLNSWCALTQWTGFSDRITWNGLENFRLLDELDLLSHAIRVTLIYAAVVMIVQNTVSLALAVALQKTNAVNSAFRSVFFIPVLISPLAAGYVWSALLSPDGWII
jgi:multiple sugar transport system permease protein/raffinose/stachyose/melibiose transport system permease protein